MRQSQQIQASPAQSDVGSITDKMVEALRRRSPHAPPKQTAATILYQAGFTATDIVEEIDDVLGRLSDVTPG